MYFWLEVESILPKPDADMLSGGDWECGSSCFSKYFSLKNTSK
jgi:hypothetical protein